MSNVRCLLKEHTFVAEVPLVALDLRYDFDTLMFCSCIHRYFMFLIIFVLKKVVSLNTLFLQTENLE